MKKMFNYHAFGLNICSELELPGILKAYNHRTDIKISTGEVTIPFQQDTPNLCIDQKDVYLWWEDIGKVKISDGKHITVYRNKKNKNRIIPFILGPVMAALLHQRGFMVLHGSSVKINENAAIAFLGDSGLGKSTTAIQLYKKGYPLITDDVLALKFDKGFPKVYPGYIHIRLSDQSFNQIKNITHVISPIRTIANKCFYDSSNNFSPEPTWLKGVYMLEKSNNIRISPLNSQKDLIELITHSTAQRIFDNSDQANNLLQCANLINNTHFCRLKTNHSFNDINKLIELVERDFSKIN